MPEIICDTLLKMMEIDQRILLVQAGIIVAIIAEFILIAILWVYVWGRK